MRPLQERWASARQQILEALEVERAEEAARLAAKLRLRTDLKSEKLLGKWIEELTSVRVLDPACGSGNFLYVALRRLLDLWLERNPLRGSGRHLSRSSEYRVAKTALRH